MPSCTASTCPLRCSAVSSSAGSCASKTRWVVSRKSSSIARSSLARASTIVSTVSAVTGCCTGSPVRACQYASAARCPSSPQRFGSARIARHTRNISSVSESRSAIRSARATWALTLKCPSAHEKNCAAVLIRGFAATSASVSGSARISSNRRSTSASGSIRGRGCRACSTCGFSLRDTSAAAGASGVGSAGVAAGRNIGPAGRSVNCAIGRLPASSEAIRSWA